MHLVLEKLVFENKLKSLKVAQVKDEIDVNEDDGCVRCCVVMLCGDVVCDGV